MDEKELLEVAEQVKQGYETKAAAMKTEFEAQLKTATENKVDKSEIEAMQTKHAAELKDITDRMLKQGEAITSLKKSKPANDHEVKSLSQQIADAHKDAGMVFGQSEEVVSFKNGATTYSYELKTPSTMLQSTNIEPNGNTIIPVPMIRPGVNEILRNKPVMLDVMNVMPTDSPLVVEINEYNPLGNAAFTAEGDPAPLESFEIQEEHVSTQEIIVKMKVSKKMLKSIPYMNNLIQVLGMKRFKLDLDSALFSGNGTTPNIKGITQYAPAFTVGSLGGSVVNPNYLDCIRAGRTSILSFSDDANPNAVLMNPTDYFKMLATKTTTEDYLSLLNELVTRGTIDGMVVIQTNRVPVGYFLMGDFDKSHVSVWENIKVEYVLENDDSTRRLVTVIIYGDFTHFVSANLTNLFIYDQFATVKTAITA